MKKITSNTNGTDLKNIKLILQHGAGYTSATNSKPILLTLHIGSNIIITAWNNITKTAALLHIDTVMQLSAAQEIIEKLEEESHNNKINHKLNHRQKIFINIIYNENISLGNQTELAAKEIIQKIINIIKGKKGNIKLNIINKPEKTNQDNSLDRADLTTDPEASIFLTLRQINPNNALGITAKTGKLIIIPENELGLSRECFSEYLYIINERKSKEIYLQQFKQLTKLELDLLIEAWPFEQVTAVSQSYYPIIIEYDGRHNNN